jgi:CheY-like chemotaxis protein
MGDILIADDDAETRRLLRLLFRLQGHDVRCAADGAAAVEAVRANPPRVLVLDVMMPVLDGLAALRALRESGSLEGVGVVMYTANPDDVAVREAVRLGVNDLVLKGRGWDELYSRVAKYLATPAVTTD